ncbi:MAG: dienelactone hydrolase family protein [Comamonas sp.]|jgi:predicted dienelactone hydrolase|uniref:alpha/beta hydrolase family protein n=1 Tax=Comamonas sp. TaxID=34028 RepID=UPI0028296421|nr:dienelactone hydrolase family protein [Comamonas sp.]MDR0213004.1 dienelactone hydrolase family protein [Comamonas sp.]
MKTLNVKRLCMLAVLALAGTAAQAAGFQREWAANAEGKPLEIGIWYPSPAAVQATPVGSKTLQVALNGPVQGKALPLVVISHGSGGSFLGHSDTAMALADAGFVVAAVTHTGDNYADQSRSVYIMDRPLQISRVIDHMLASWNGRASIDPERIGIFGFSAGGFTALVNIGGAPDFSKTAAVCRQYPADFACQLLAKSKQPMVLPPSNTTVDGRIKAAVVAAPALGFVFAPDGLSKVKVPVQLWRAEDDTLVPHPRYAEAVRLALPLAPDYHVVPRAGHFDFMAPCDKAQAMRSPDICTSAPGFDRVAFHVRFNAAVVDFFRKTLGAR